MNELIVVEQLPIIKYKLEQLSKEIKEKVDRANSLVVNDDTVKEVKQVRASLNKEFNELEEQRKKVKSAIMAKYDEFNEIYVENVSNLYKDADTQLKEKIDNVENQLKQEKIEELELFARQHFEFNNIDDIVNFDDIGLNITLSASMKSLKDQVLAFVEKVVNDLKLIELEEYKDEIMVEYKNTKDFTQAKLDVIARHKMLNELKEKQNEINEEKQREKQIINNIEKIIEIPEEIIEIQFTIKTTKTKAKKVKEFLLTEGIEYE